MPIAEGLIQSVGLCVKVTPLSLVHMYGQSIGHACVMAEPSELDNMHTRVTGVGMVHPISHSVGSLGCLQLVVL